MNIKVVDQTPKIVKRIPEIGEMWRHPNGYVDGCVYMRIPDVVLDLSRFSYAHGMKNQYICSVDLGDAVIRTTSKDSEFEILEQVEGLKVCIKR